MTIRLHPILGATSSALKLGRQLCRGVWDALTTLLLMFTIVMGPVVVILFLAPTEMYFPLWPSIDTYFTDGYSEEGFDRIQVGMSKAEVVAILGEPFPTPEGLAASTWCYSHDGKCRFKDFAWLGRSIDFGNGVVVRIEKRVFYD